MEEFGDYPVKSNVHERQKLTTNFIGIVGGEVSKAGDPPETPDPPGGVSLLRMGRSKGTLEEQGRSEKRLPCPGDVAQ